MSSANTVLVKVTVTADNEEWRRGFEDCAELVEEMMFNTHTLDQVRENVKKLLALVKERKFNRIREELGLF